MQKVTCRDCSHLRVYGRARENGNNRGLKGPRTNCHCNHPKAIETFNRMCPNNPRMAGFIGYTPPGESRPACKTAPRWCPLKQMDASDKLQFVAGNQQNDARRAF